MGINIASLVLLGGLFFMERGAARVRRLLTWKTTPNSPPPWRGMSATEVAFAIWSTQIRYLGVGAMITGGLWAIISLRGSLVEAFRRGFGKSEAAGHHGGDRPAIRSDGASC